MLCVCVFGWISLAFTIRSWISRMQGFTFFHRCFPVHHFIVLCGVFKCVRVDVCLWESNLSPQFYSMIILLFSIFCVLQRQRWCRGKKVERKKWFEERIWWENMCTKAVIKRRSKIGRNRWVKKQSEGRNEEKKNELRDVFADDYVNRVEYVCWVMDAAVGFDIRTHSHTLTCRSEEKEENEAQNLKLMYIFSSYSCRFYFLSSSSKFHLMIALRIHILQWNAITSSLPHGLHEIDVFGMILTQKMCIEQINNNIQFGNRFHSDFKRNWSKRDEEDRGSKSIPSTTASPTIFQSMASSFSIPKWGRFQSIILVWMRINNFLIQCDYKMCIFETNWSQSKQSTERFFDCISMCMLSFPVSDSFLHLFRIQLRFPLAFLFIRFVN